MQRRYGGVQGYGGVDATWRRRGGGVEAECSGVGAAWGLHLNGKSMDLAYFGLVDVLVFVLVDELDLVLVHVLGCVLVTALVCAPVENNFQHLKPRHTK